MRTILFASLLFSSLLFAGVDTTRWLRAPKDDDVAGAGELDLDAQPESLLDEEPGSKLFSVMAGMVPEDNYTLSEHFATTADGYVLRVFRLHARDHPERSAAGRSTLGARSHAPRPAILLQHALLDSSAGWLVMGPTSSLPFMLADAGFDVWMGNVRGNRFSRNHTTLDPDTQPQFWAYSFDHHALKDLPAMVQLVLDVTGVTSLQYVGYSQGTMMALGALSTGEGSLTGPVLPRGAISAAVLLAPVAYTRHITSLPFIAATKLNLAQRLTHLGLAEFGSHDDRSAAVASRFCGVLPWPCTKWLQLLCGANSAQDVANGNLAPKLLPLVVTHLPAGTSVQNMAHWGQGVSSRGKLAAGPAMYDFGTTCTSHEGGQQPCNQLVYGTDTPPVYNLSAITTPLALFTGGQDSLSDPKDVLLLLDALRPGIVVNHTHIPEYAHLDFGIGTDAHTRLYPTVTQLLLDLRAKAQRGLDRSAYSHAHKSHAIHEDDIVAAS